MTPLDQAVVCIFGLAGIALSQSRRPSLERWACVPALIGQAGWFHFAVTEHSWFLIALACGYTASWGIGVYNYWVRPWLARRRAA